MNHTCAVQDGNSIEEMFSSGTSNEDVFTMQLRSMMHGEDNDKVRQTVAWTVLRQTFG